MSRITELPSDFPGVAAAARGGARLVRSGLVANSVLTVVKLVAGLLGNSYALVADAIESATDMVGSLLVWGGLRIASRNPDERYPFGYGKAEPIAAAAVGALMLGTAGAIVIKAIREIRVPHSKPAAWTLVVLALVILLKEYLYRRSRAASRRNGSVALEADAWHHRADAFTSLAAFTGISIALIGGPGWAQADAWAALVAAFVIAVNGGGLIRISTRDLMDRAPEPELYSIVGEAALGTPGVLAIEKMKIRKSGMEHYVDIHVQALPTMSLRDAHNLSGRVKYAIRQAVPTAAGVLIHMEPFEPGSEKNSQDSAPPENKSKLLEGMSHENQDLNARMEE